MLYFDDLFFVQNTEATENGFVNYLLCNPSHPVYRAHFPGSPITPGACLLQTAGVLLQQHLGRPLHLTSSKNIKYLNVLVPAEGKEVRYAFSNITETDGGCKVQLVIADASSVYSKMSLSYSYEPV